MDPQQVHQLNQDLKNWGQKTQQSAQIAISADGIAKALEAGKADYERRQFDRDVVIWMHVATSVLYNDHKPKERGQYPIERLFELMNTKTYRTIMDNARKKFATDEVPNDFFRDLYRRFLEWQAKNPPTNSKNYGAKSLNERWELGEIKKEKWMGNDTVGELDED